MAEFIHEHSTRLKDEDGTAYVVRIYARERPDGTWEGWLEFHPTDERFFFSSRRRHTRLVSDWSSDVCSSDLSASRSPSSSRRASGLSAVILVPGMNSIVSSREL